MNFFKKEKQPGVAFDVENFDDSQLPLQLKRIMDHLGFLEKKIDMLLDQSKQRQGFRPPFGNRNFSGSRGNYSPQGNRYGGHRPEGHRPARPSHYSGRPFQKKHTPHQGTPTHPA